MKGGTAAPSSNFTTAGGYTPIPDQQSMGGLGAGDVFIDCCGETVPVRDPGLCTQPEFFHLAFSLLSTWRQRSSPTTSAGALSPGHRRRQHQLSLPSALQKKGEIR